MRAPCLLVSHTYPALTRPAAPGWRLERRMDVLLAHGVCHLMGYTHDDDDDFAEMSAREEELLREHVNFLDVDGESSL